MPGVVLGYVYFIEEVGADRVKIGYSRRPWKRLNGLRASVASELRMRWVFTGTKADETRCHWVFQHHQIRGEWFQLSAVVAGFRYYGFDPESFPNPQRVRDLTHAKRRTILLEHRRQLADYVKVDGRFVRKRKKGGNRKKCGKRGGTAWATEEGQARLSGMTLSEFREMKRRIRLDWLRKHPEDRRPGDPV